MRESNVDGVQWPGGGCAEELPSDVIKKKQERSTEKDTLK